ncbi:MAG: DUF1638 domain-containing protein [Clostridiales Family XIII bacterium]|jgi:hypothetical protein|nr:DUF1638 domain-containing protein [Clostridiales Family XIII bacterium]
MATTILACGIFRPEIERVLPQVMKQFEGHDVELRFMEAALHVDDRKLEETVSGELAEAGQESGGKTVLLYGKMCHPEMQRMAGGANAALPQAANCIELLLDPARKKALDESEEIFYLTSGWLASWEEIFRKGLRWDEVDARINFGRYDRILVLDDGCFPIDEETLFAFFDYAQKPVEVEPVDLTYFQDTLARLIEQAQAQA